MCVECIVEFAAKREKKTRSKRIKQNENIVHIYVWQKNKSFNVIPSQIAKAIKKTMFVVKDAKSEARFSFKYIQFLLCANCHRTTERERSFCRSYLI